MSAIRRCVDDHEKMVDRASADLFWGEHFYFLPVVCVFLFFWLDLFGVGGVLQCSTSLFRGRIG